MLEAHNVCYEMNDVGLICGTTLEFAGGTEEVYDKLLCA
jgi:hypothetical protein